MTATPLTLLAAAKAALATAESHIHDQYQGTQSYRAQLADLQPVRDAIDRATPAWEPLTHEVRERLNYDDCYWVAVRGQVQPFKALYGWRKPGGRPVEYVFFTEGGFTVPCEAISHIMPFVAPAMPVTEIGGDIAALRHADGKVGPTSFPNGKA